MRDDLQAQIDIWHRENTGSFEFSDYKAFLQDIGYLVPPGDDFAVTPENVDTEITLQAGPQLVVPIMNARFALNAANARWGSLYDALYGNDVISEEGGADKSGAYNPVRGQKVIDYGRDFLDVAAPLTSGSHHQSIAYRLVDQQLQVKLSDGSSVALAEKNQLMGYLGDTENPTSILLKNNNLHLEIQVDSSHNVGSTDKASVKDIVLESALTTIMDCEDSVAAVDAEDKALAYANWLGLIKGDLQQTITRGSSSFVRKMNEDRHYIGADGSPLVLNGRSLLFIRNVGHLMTNNAILNSQGDEIPEGIMDGFITSLCALHDIRGPSAKGNSRTGSIYIVKPKMHGPEEVTFTCDLFGRIEDLLDLPKNTLKVGIMDEERRTSVNLKACIAQASERVAFINTGFLDRTGDEIHTSMQAGVMLPKGIMKQPVDYCL